MRQKLHVTGSAYVRPLKVRFQDSGQHLLQDCLSPEPFIFFAPEREAASKHAVQEDAT